MRWLIEVFDAEPEEDEEEEEENDMDANSTTTTTDESKETSQTADDDKEEGAAPPAQNRRWAERNDLFFPGKEVSNLLLCNDQTCCNLARRSNPNNIF